MTDGLAEFENCCGRADDGKRLGEVVRGQDARHTVESRAGVDDQRAGPLLELSEQR